MTSETELLARAAEMRRNPTEWEKRLWRELSGTKLGHKFRRQHVIAPYIADFFCPAKGVIVEVDGDTHDPVADMMRDRFTAKKGFRTLRFSNLDIRENMEGVLLTIVHTLQATPDRWSGLPHPNPSPEREGLAR
ncbi:endonuclease domain-containing protein [uncultured Sphingomonas sp.]|uniref:endonuclease domain-containing protein n=1 Tax=uncultured Sphingomonas sp. TaxID=158754 RepID=UPI0025DCCD4D|nr:endonuclease domain-containing protein [uncultured Sphingomonas sp.]